MVEITAVDNNGKKVTKLNRKIVVTLPTLRRKSSKSCLGYQESKGKPFKCDNRDPKV